MNARTKIILEKRVERLHAGQSILRVLESSGFKLMAIAAALDISPSAISGWRAGRRVPPRGRLDQLRLLARKHIRIDYN